MPLSKGYTKATMKKNVKQLMTEKPSARRSKGIATIAERRGVPKKAAEAIQATAIARRIQREEAGKKGDRKLSMMVKKSGQDGRGGASSGVRRLMMSRLEAKKSKKS